MLYYRSVAVLLSLYPISQIKVSIFSIDVSAVERYGSISFNHIMLSEVCSLNFLLFAPPESKAVMAFRGLGKCLNRYRNFFTPNYAILKETRSLLFIKTYLIDIPYMCGIISIEKSKVIILYGG